MRGREGLRRERGKKKGREVNSYLLSFCCDIQIWSCEATLLVDNVYLRTTCAVISLIYTRPLIQLNIKQIHVQIRKWKYLCKNLVGKEGEGICSKEVYYCKLMVHAMGFHTGCWYIYTRSAHSNTIQYMYWICQDCECLILKAPQKMPECGKAQWDCKIINYYIALPLQQ